MGLRCYPLSARSPRFRLRIACIVVPTVDAPPAAAHACGEMPKSEEELRIVVRAFPATDQAFADAAGDALLEALEAREALATIHDVVEKRLRGAYRNARIHVQDDLGHLGPGETVWYAYRDGRIRENDPRRERLYTVVAAARRTVEESKVVLGRSREASRAAGYDDERTPGRDPVSRQQRGRRRLPDQQPPDRQPKTRA